MSTWFASDVHLDAARPDITRAFDTFLRVQVRGAQRLFVLGDLFESWVGDDDPDPDKALIVATLRALSDAGTACFFMHGNRDFLVGEDFAAATGAELLPEEWVGDFYGEPVLLMHGDSLCTDDVEYMAVRKTARDPSWQAGVLTLPLAQRIAMAKDARAHSAKRMTDKPEDIMDVNQEAVAAALARHGVRRLIHGHTHRPATHSFTSDGQIHTRHVLGDWYDQGRVLKWDEDGLREITLRRLAADHCES